MFHVWNNKLHCPTRVLDLLRFGPDDSKSLKESVLGILRIPCPEDGLTFEEASLVVAPIREDMEYGRVRVKLRSNLGNIRIPIQTDVGFGDAIMPEPELHEYPTLLDDMPGAKLRAYPSFTVIAEKFEALVRLDQ